MGLKEKGWEDVDWIRWDEDRGKGRGSYGRVSWKAKQFLTNEILASLEGFWFMELGVR